MLWMRPSKCIVNHGAKPTSTVCHHPKCAGVLPLGHTTSGLHVDSNTSRNCLSEAKDRLQAVHVSLRKVPFHIHLKEQSEHANTLISLSVHAADRVESGLAGSFCTSDDRDPPQIGHDIGGDSITGKSGL
jgi:hypothetical protein